MKSILAAATTALAHDLFLEPQYQSAGDCPGGSLQKCIHLCPAASASVFAVCVESCSERCSDSPSPPAPHPVPPPTPPPTPPPPTPPAPPPAPPGPPIYCPDESSWVWEGATWNGAGWTVNGGGGVTGKTSFNLLGGYVEFDVDNGGSKWGVNNNFYTISPDHPYTNRNDYCDGQGPEASSPLGIYCMEMDIYEANGAQNLATTWHTWFNHDGGCDQGGCGAGMDIGGQFHVKAEFGEDGWMHTYFNGNEIGGFSPYPSSNAANSVRDTMSSRGVVFSSSQWTGWVPGAGNVNGDVDNSVFSIRNVRVSGSVVMGPEPPKCTGPSPSPSPSPSPTPSPTPGPSCDCSWAASGCGWDDGSACFKECCSSKCDCSWAASGCGWDDGSACFHQCCGYEMANSTDISV